jgi:hypothetical protein
MGENIIKIDLKLMGYKAMVQDRVRWLAAIRR